MKLLFSLQLSILFIDMEGDTIQELSAIEMNAQTRQIVDVYHEYARTEHGDFYSRRHIHGLSVIYLNEFGFQSETALIYDFKKWLRTKNILAMYANNPAKEKTALNFPVKDIELPVWKERILTFANQTANTFKNKSVPVLNKSCPKIAHNAFQYFPVHKNSPTELAKRSYGHHCALYDTYELYLHYVTS